MQVELDLPADVERRIRSMANRHGTTADDVLSRIVIDEFGRDTADDLAAAEELQKAIDDYEAGRVMDGETFFRQLREKYGLPPRDRDAG